MKHDVNNIVNENILVSWDVSSSSAPKPSLSITNMEQLSPSTVYPNNGFPQIHNPFVHGFTVGPTPKPSLRLSSILFSRYDFPVLYMPATPTTPMGGGKFWIISIASGLT